MAAASSSEEPPTTPSRRFTLPTLAYNGGLADELHAARWMALGIAVIGGFVVAVSWSLSQLLEAILKPFGDWAFGNGAAASWINLFFCSEESARTCEAG